MNPAETYARALNSRRKEDEGLSAADLRLANWRTVVFFVAAGVALGSWGFGQWSAAWLAFPGAAFLFLVIRHDRLAKKQERTRRAIAYYERAQRRLADEWHGDGRTEDLAEPDHPYSSDLDVFGVGSLFDLVATTRTRTGTLRLAEYFLHPADHATIQSRQRIVDELRDRWELRENLALQADGVDGELHPETLVRWAENPPAFKNSGTLKLVAWVGTLFGLAAAIAWPLTPLGPIPLLLVVVGQMLVNRRVRDAVDLVTSSIENPERELRVLSTVLALLEREPARSPELRTLIDRLTSHGGTASAAIDALARRVVWLDAMRNQFFYPIGFVLMWRLHFALRIEAWRLEHGPRIAEWLDALGELEALFAISGFSFERPEYTTPTVLTDSPAQFSAVDLGHPLLPRKTCVANDISFEGVRFFLVSGSNMSGKSTLLRTIGLNAVLAFAGAPVRASSLKLSVLSIGASLRTQDSLLSGKSRFYAEILRLKQVLDIARTEAPALVLLDEILHGTNSHDRRTGAHALLERFLSTDALGLITTHDLALADAAAELAPRVRNVHLRDEIVAGELEFDYKLRPGIVERSNALALMKAVGLDI